MNIRLVFLAFASILCVSTRATDLPLFTSQADAFFKKYVANSLVDYAQVKKNFTEIEALYNSIGAMDLKSIGDNGKKSFYINAYNLVVIYSVVKNYPLKSPLDVNGFFDKLTHRVAGEELTLNKLENDKLLRVYSDSRFHFVLVCAAKSCPPLPNFAYLPDKIEEQLTDRTKIAINNSEWLKVNIGQKSVSLSKIFEWYKTDFTTNGKELDWINLFRKETIPTSYTITYYEYDWALNKK